jgi:hypothetical protein
MIGNMLISGRNSGQVRLAIHGPGNFQAITTNVGVTLENIIRDAELKLAELKASPSPIETEIKFVEHWLLMAQESLKSVVEEAVEKVADLAGLKSQGSGSSPLGTSQTPSSDSSASQSSSPASPAQVPDNVTPITGTQTPTKPN